MRGGEWGAIAACVALRGALTMGAMSLIGWRKIGLRVWTPWQAAAWLGVATLAGGLFWTLIEMVAERTRGAESATTGWVLAGLATAGVPLLIFGGGVLVRVIGVALVAGAGVAIAMANAPLEDYLRSA